MGTPKWFKPPRVPGADVISKRKSAYSRGYDKEWKRVRAAYLIHNPICVDCSKPATHVDHKIAISEGGAKYDWDNLQSLCHSCHSRKTVLYDGGFGRKKERYNRRIDRDGSEMG